MRRILVALVTALLLGLAAFMLFVVSVVHVASRAPAVYSSEVRRPGCATP